MLTQSPAFKLSRRAELALSSLSESARKRVESRIRQAGATWPNLPAEMHAVKRRIGDDHEIQVARAGKDIRVFMSYDQRHGLLVEDIASARMLKRYFDWQD